MLAGRGYWQRPETGRVSTSGLQVDGRECRWAQCTTLQLWSACIVWLLCVSHSGLSGVSSLVAPGVKVGKSHMTGAGGSTGKDHCIIVAVQPHIAARQEGRRELCCQHSVRTCGKLFALCPPTKSSKSTCYAGFFFPPGEGQRPKCTVTVPRLWEHRTIF